MSLARALTKRYRPGHHDDAPPESPRSFGGRKGGTYIDRAKISLPIELLSTTNVLAYDAPDIHPINTQTPLSAMSSSSSTKSYDDSDASPGLSSSSSVSSAHMSRESSPIIAEPNDLPPYLHTKTASTTTTATVSEEPAAPEIPSLPARALSHTKKSHQALARKRSQTHMANAVEPAPASPSSVRRPSFDFNFKTESSHPFGAELDQVDEIAEEFGVKDNVRIWDEEEQYLMAHGLFRFEVDDYLAEIEPLKFGLWDDAPSSNTMAWL